jgi:hypothetical protein
MLEPQGKRTGWQRQWSVWTRDLTQNGETVMRLETVGKVVAERTLDLDANANGARSEIRVLFGAPKRIPGSTDVYCPYQILGLGDETVRYTEGVDGAQAMYLAMEAVGTTLNGTPEMRSGRLTWYGERSLGFPVRAERPRLRLVASN